MKRIQVIFVVGPSGAGKSFICPRLEAEFKLLHIDLDGRDKFREYGLRKAWGAFCDHQDPRPLISALHGLIAEHSKSGAMLSFPSTRVLTHEEVCTAMAGGICMVVLWGTKDQCLQGRLEREPDYDLGEYDKSNAKAFKEYGSPEFADFRVDAFRPDGSRPEPGQIINIIRQRLAE